MGVASDDAEPCAVGPRLSPVAPYVQVRGRGLRRCVNSTVCGRSSIYIYVCVCVYMYFCVYVCTWDGFIVRGRGSGRVPEEGTLGRGQREAANPA